MRLRVTCLALLLASTLLTGRAAAASPTVNAAATQGPATASSVIRTLNVPQTTGSVASAWNVAPIFWFGQATENNNYVDVRVAYDRQALYVFATIVDYYLWNDPTGASDPRTYDAFTLYLDTTGNRPTAPQNGDYEFASGFRGSPTTNDPRWHRQGRGTGSGWDETWVPPTDWTDNIGLRYYNSGPNNNSDRDAGWATTLTIPWSTLGLSGPPLPGAVWGLGALLDDRDDQPPAGAVPNEYWPTGLVASNPSSWGQIAFNPPAYVLTHLPTAGTLTLRRGLNTAFVWDAYAGGGGTCSGGINGGGDLPHPTDNLFVQNESDMSDFPCFSKSYLQFDLSAIPAGKIITAASLTMYQIGNSDPTTAVPSYVQLSSVTDNWSESTLTWNNAPLATENLTGAWINPLATFPGWPGVAITWDATELVADAYGDGQPANLALYEADTTYNSGKYLVSSDAGDWDANGRPALTVTWADPVLGVSGAVDPAFGAFGDVVTYTVTTNGTGRAVTVTDPLPGSLSYVSGSATSGATYDGPSLTVRWSGAPAAGQSASFSFQAQITTASPGVVVNTISASDGAGLPVTASISTVVNGFAVYLPIVE